MSLNTWSLIVFASYLLFYSGMMIAMANTPKVSKIIFMISSWFINQIIVMWYGFATDQIGFILISLFQFVATLVTMIMLIGKELSNANQQS